MPLTREDLRNRLRQGDLLPVYVLYGEETNLRDLAAKTIADLAFKTDDFRDFNISEFSLGTEESLRDAISAAEQLPMMSSRRVVRISNVRVSQSGRGDTVKESHEQLLQGYLDNPSPTSVVIFVADELNGVRKMGKLLRGADGAVEFKPPETHEMQERAARQFADAGVAIDRASLAHLIETVGPDTRRLENEVNKLIAASFPDKKVAVELIDALISDNRELDNFALTNQILAKNSTRALEVLRYVLDDGAEPVMILGQLGASYRKMYAAADMMERGVERREVEKFVRLPYRQMEDFLRLSRQSGTRRLGDAIHHIAETDLAIKTSVGGGAPAGPRMQIEKLVAQLVSL